MPKRRTILLVALLVVGAIVGAYFGGLLSIVALDTETKVAAGHPLRFLGGGYGTSGPGGDEMLSSIGYVSSFRSSGQSETMTARATFIPSCSVLGIIETQPAAHFWRVYFDSVKKLDSTTFGIPAAQCGNLGAYQTFEFSFVGPHNGAVRVELWSKFITAGFTSDFGVVLSDQAYISDQFGAIVSPTEHQVFEVGQTVNFQVRFAQDCPIDYKGQSVGGDGWLFVLTRHDGSIILQKDLGCGSRDIQSVTIPYKTTAADFGGAGKNFLIAELFTRLFLKDSRAVRTIDLLSLKPGAPTITVSDTDVVEGDSVTITITAPAGTTGSILYSLTVQYVDGFLVDRLIDVSQNTFQYQMPKAGTIKITASVTVDGRPGDPAVQTIVAADKDDPTCAETNTCEEETELPLLAIVLLLVGIFLVLGGVFIPGFRIKIILLALGGAIVLVAVLSLTGAL